MLRSARAHSPLDWRPFRIMQTRTMQMDGMVTVT